MLGSLGRHRGVTCHQKAAGDICSAGTVPREWCCSHPPHLSAAVDHHEPRRGSKAEPGWRWLLPGSCGSSWERQGRPVRCRAVITTLGTEKDYPPCAPFAEFSGLPLAKQMQKRCHLFAVPMTVQDEEVKKKCLCGKAVILQPKSRHKAVLCKGRALVTGV